MHEMERERDEDLATSNEIIAFLRSQLLGVDQENILVSKIIEETEEAEGGPEEEEAAAEEEKVSDEPVSKSEEEEEDEDEDQVSEEDKEDLPPELQKLLSSPTQEKIALKKQIEKEKSMSEIMKKPTVLSHTKTGLNIQYMEEKRKKQEEEKQAQEKQREEDLEQLKQAEEVPKTIVFPQYGWDDRLKVMREVRKPPASVYLELGYNEVDTDDRKHYRKIFDDELENDKEIFPKPAFHAFEIIRG